MTDAIKIITSNKKATFEYKIEERFEAGLVLLGTEVKSLRAGKANLQEAYCNVESGEMVIRGCHIAPYDHGNRANHEPARTRKLLLHKREIEKLDKATRQKGYTIVPMKLYFKNGRAKLEIGLGKGKKLYDKRADIADRESSRRLDRLRVSGGRDGD